MYATLSNWSWQAPPAAVTPENMVAQLARRLEKSPGDLDGWMKLGRSYLVLQQYPLAARAYQRADRLADGKNAEALIGVAEALALSDEAELDGRAGRMIEQALSVDPRSPKALYYGAVTALRRNDLPLARSRFASLLELGPPEKIRPLLQRQIAAIDAQMATAAAANAAAKSSMDVESAPARIEVEVSVAPALRTSIDSSAPLFVVVREPGVRGPPLAVKRLASRFPQTISLTSANAMIQGRTFSAGQEVEVLARVARSGNPVGASGDPFGVITTHAGERRVLELTIDRLTP
jgi:cytochrome c-type biogenesis protein CcmH